MAYLVITLKDGRRAWYRDTNTRLDKTGVAQQVPLFDDERGKEVSLAFAIDASRAWRSYCLSAFGSNLQIVNEKYGQPFEVGESSSGTPAADVRQKHFVTFTNGLGLFVTPGRNADGEAWFVRSVDVPTFTEDNRHTALETRLFSRYFQTEERGLRRSPYCDYGRCIHACARFSDKVCSRLHHPTAPHGFGCLEISQHDHMADRGTAAEQCHSIVHPRPEACDRPT